MNERERIIEIMKSQELNSKQLSLELGVSAGTISNILGGRNKPSLELLQNIANHFPFIKYRSVYALHPLGIWMKRVGEHIESQAGEAKVHAFYIIM